MQIKWTHYMQYRLRLRRFDAANIEDILRHSKERYFDTATNNHIAVGSHGKQLIMIPYEQHDDSVTPITVHATSRQQINFRLKNGRFIT